LIRDLITSLSTKAELLPYSELYNHLFTHEFLHMSSLQSTPTAAPLLPASSQPLFALVAQHDFSDFNGNVFSHNQGRERHGG